MKDYDYGSKPISAWGYVGYSFLYAIPVVGWIVWLINALFAKNRNVKSHARSYFCAILLALVLVVIAVVVVAVLYLLGLLDAAKITEVFGITLPELGA